MKLSKHLSKTTTLLILLTLPLAPTVAAEPQSDEGLIAFVPGRVDWDTTLAVSGNRVINFRRDGVAITGNPDSPLYQASIEMIGTIAMDPEGRVVKSTVALMALDPEGNAIWAWGVNEPGPTDTYRVQIGFLDQEGIRGKLRIETSGSALYTPDPELWERSFLYDNREGFEKLAFSIDWTYVDVETLEQKHPHSYTFVKKGEPRQNTTIHNEYKYEGPYTQHDAGVSFHGSHMLWGVRPTGSGYNISSSYQKGFVRHAKEPHGPMGHMGYLGRGWEILERDVQGESSIMIYIMLIDYIDDDGDILWLMSPEALYIEGEYDLNPEGPSNHLKGDLNGSGGFAVGGTGKWESFVGTGVATGAYRHPTGGWYHTQRLDYDVEEPAQPAE